jgi:hypothetical protein
MLARRAVGAWETAQCDEGSGRDGDMILSRLAESVGAAAREVSQRLGFPIASSKRGGEA